jgi:hypothetical protein
MPVKIYTGSPSFPVFEFDITESETKERSYTPTKRPVEDKGNVNDHVYREPFSVSSDGFVAWTPVTPRDWQPVPSTQKEVMIDAQNALEELAEKRQLVTYSGQVFTGQVVITKLSFGRTTAGGWSNRVSIGFAEIEIARALTTTVDPSRLRPKVQKKAAAKPGQKTAPTGIPDATKLKFLGKGSVLFENTYGRN